MNVGRRGRNEKYSLFLVLSIDGYSVFFDSNCCYGGIIQMLFCKLLVVFFFSFDCRILRSRALMCYFLFLFVLVLYFDLFVQKLKNGNFTTEFCVCVCFFLMFLLRPFSVLSRSAARSSIILHILLCNSQ